MSLEVRKLLNIEIEGQVFLDDEDIRRMGYLMRKHPRPANLKMLLTDGHVEDLFGAWFDESERDGGFNPDLGRGVIFDI